MCSPQPIRSIHSTPIQIQVQLLVFGWQPALTHSHTHTLTHTHSLRERERERVVERGTKCCSFSQELIEELTDPPESRHTSSQQTSASLQRLQHNNKPPYGLHFKNLLPFYFFCFVLFFCFFPSCCSTGLLSQVGCVSGVCGSDRTWCYQCV